MLKRISLGEWIWGGIMATAAIAMLTIIFTRNSEQARRTACAGNLQKIGSVLIEYAAANADTLPNTDFGGSWYWDVSPGVFKLICDPIASKYGLSSDAARRVFYCPSNPTQNNDGLWNFTAYRVIGYHYFGKRAGSFPESMTEVMNLNGDKRVPPLGFYEHMTKVETDDPSRTDLAVDTIISYRRELDFGRPTGYTPGFAVPHITSHMARGNKPQGANVLSFDAHVEWRDFNPKTTFVCGVGKDNPPAGSPFFWFPAPN